MVERTPAWLTSRRRLARDYERDPAVSEALIRWAAVQRRRRHVIRQPAAVAAGVLAPVLNGGSADNGLSLGAGAGAGVGPACWSDDALFDRAGGDPDLAARMVADDLHRI